MHMGCTSRTGRWAAALALTLATAAVGRADELTIDNLKLTNVRITSVADGTVEYISAGSRRNTALDDIQAIELSRYPSFGEAVAATADDPRAAAGKLRDLLTDVREDYLLPLIQLRLSEALDAAGDFGGALEAYLKAVDGDDSAYFTTRAPKNLPDRPEARRRAVLQVERAIGRARDPAVKRNLEALRAQLTAAPDAGDNGEPPTPDDGRPAVAPTPGPAVDPSAAFSEGRVMRISSVETLLERQRYDEALKQISEFMDKEAGRRMLAELYYYRGRAEAGKGEHLSAALSLLRVPVHFPDHPLAVPALELAGAELQADDQPDAARKVWQRAIEMTDDAATKRRIQRMIDAL